MFRSHSYVRLVAGLMLVATTSSVAVAQSSGSPTVAPKKLIFILPDGFRGWLCVDFGVPGAAPLPREGDAGVIRPSPGEVLQTSDKAYIPELFGEAWYGVNGRRIPLPEGVTLQPGPSRSESSEPEVRACAFVGTIDERDAAVPAPGFANAQTRNLAVPAEEHEALVALYRATGGDHWTHHVGWLGTPGNECNWHGVDCESGDGSARVVGLDLEGNNLTGKIPTEVGQLTKLESLNLSENHLTGTIPVTLEHLNNLKWLYLSGNQLSGLVPESLIQRWLDGPLSISVEARLLSDVSKIDFEFNASALLCAQRRLILGSDGNVTSYTVRCRNAVPGDRSTYCEVKEGQVSVQEFARLGRLIERNGFFGLRSSYQRNITEGAFEDTRVIKKGKSYSVSDYEGAGPFRLWVIQRAIEGVGASVEWTKTSTEQKCPRW